MMHAAAGWPRKNAVHAPAQLLPNAATGAASKVSETTGQSAKSAAHLSISGSIPRQSSR